MSARVSGVRYRNGRPAWRPPRPAGNAKPDRYLSAGSTDPGAGRPARRRVARLR